MHNGFRLTTLGERVRLERLRRRLGFGEPAHVPLEAHDKDLHLPVRIRQIAAPVSPLEKSTSRAANLRLDHLGKGAPPLVIQASGRRRSGGSPGRFLS
jgi:hypothetical protein